ncbi:hypothetical protein OAL74_02070 [Candidatus Pelagibacter sp.]|nr:hypothetical protein [Candidatus Pelagibacter sp.]
MKKKLFGIVLSLADYKNFYNQNKKLFDELSNNFKEVYVINVEQLKFRSNIKNIKNEKILPKNFICKNFSKSSEFLKYFHDKELIALQYLSKNPDYFKIFFLLKLAKIKNIIIMNLGNYGNKQTFSFNKKNLFAFRHFYLKGFYYLYRFLNLINIFPKVDILFECKKDTIKAIKNGISQKFERKFPYFRISYFRKIVQINSVFYDHYLNYLKSKKEIKNQILYIDVPFNHPDRVLREGYCDKKQEKFFYKKIHIFLNYLSKLYKYKIVIGLHPSTKNGEKKFKNFLISRESTIDQIKKSKIIVVTHSSLIPLAVLYKKKIISIHSILLGDYHNNLITKYQKSLYLESYNLDLDIKNFNKKEFDKKKIKNYFYQKKFIKNNICSTPQKKSCNQIIEVIKKDFFS